MKNWTVHIICTKIYVFTTEQSGDGEANEPFISSRITVIVQLGEAFAGEWERD